MKTIREYFYYLWKKISEKQLRKHYSVYFNESLERYQQCKDKKSEKQIKEEINRLKKYWGCYPYQYFRYDMYRKDCSYTIEEMQKYVPLYFAFYLFYPRMYKKYGILCNDKSLTSALLDSYKIQQPKLLFSYENKLFFSKTNSLISDDYIDKFIATATYSKLFIKPCFGVGGKGIVVFNKQLSGEYRDEKGLLFTSDYFQRNLDSSKYIVQSGVLQGNEINSIYEHSVNTFRIFTEYKNNKAKIVLSMLRMGQGKKQVDNYSSGGITIKVDPVTGQLDTFGYGYQRKHVHIHPDTGFKFSGYQLGCWPEIVSFVLKCAVQFREIPILGWDIAYAEDGPTVIEINEGPSVEAIQDCYGGVQYLLGIENPQNWWKYDNYILSEK